jgi:hypothetical protein
MSDATRPQLTDITRALTQIADRVLASNKPGLEPYVSGTLKLVLRELETYIPGLDEPPNPEAARAFGEAAEIALRDGDAREGMSYALRGLSCAPHHPHLWYVAGAACVEVGGLEPAVRMMRHALWIHPGHRDARRDLDALTAFLDRNEGEDRAA